MSGLGRVLALLALVPAAGCEFEPPDDPACWHRGFSLRIYATPVQSVDMLIWIDDSHSMIEEQAALAEQLPVLIGELLSPEDRDGDTRPDHPPLQDVNVGVVEPGMPSTDALPGCSASPTAETGCLLRNPPVPGTGCADAYPPFQSWSVFTDDATDAARIARDLGCVGAVGTDGCTFTQPFASVVETLTTQTAPGRCNEGFLRDDAILYLLWISDGDDGSASAEHPELFDLDEPLGWPAVRSALHPELLEPVDTFLDAIRRLKPPDDQHKIALGMIVGVPPDAPACSGSGDQLEGCLGMSAMQVATDPAAPTSLIPSCNTMQATATPPRRFVQLAQAFGSQATVESICMADWRDALRPVTDLLVDRLVLPCFPRELPLAEGECVPDCVVVETLSTDRACLEDPTCLGAWCRAAEEGDSLRPPPCIDPATGAVCRPFKRDLGVVTGGGGTAHRQCLMRASARTWDAASGRCSEPTEAGWIYDPPEASRGGCPELRFFHQGDYRPGALEPGSTAELHCGLTVCGDEDAGGD